jgi:hypothetical protein
MARPAPGLLWPWLVLAGAAVLLPWVLYVPAGGTFGAALAAGALVKALWPVLAGVALAWPLARWGARLPAPPEGDVIVLARRAVRACAPIAPALARAEAVLRAWPAAGLALLVVALALGLAMAAP